MNKEAAFLDGYVDKAVDQVPKKYKEIARDTLGGAKVGGTIGVGLGAGFTLSDLVRALRTEPGEWGSWERMGDMHVNHPFGERPTQLGRLFKKLSKGKPNLKTVGKASIPYDLIRHTVKGGKNLALVGAAIMAGMYPIKKGIESYKKR